MLNNYTYDNQGLLLTEGFEGLRTTAYYDTHGVLTNGYGHTGADVYPGQVISLQRAVDWLSQDVASAVQTVNDEVLIKITQDEFDALVDFTFNEGCGHFASSTLLNKLNAGDFVGAANEFSKWIYIGGGKSSGLIRRRDAEDELFVRG